MIEWMIILLDCRPFMRINGLFGFILLGLFLYLYFSKEGKDERGRGIMATASLSAFAMLFFSLNVFACFLPWFMDNIVRISNGIQLVYTIVLLTADIAALVLRKIGYPKTLGV